MAERKMADALQELYDDGVKAKMKDFIIANIDTIVEQLADKYLAKNAKAASATTADSATKATQDGNGNVISSTYLTQTNAATTYLTKSDASTTYLSKSTASSTYATKSELSGAGTTYSTGNASTAGITKLYTGTGSATDGTMTQNAITTALGNKLDKSTWDDRFAKRENTCLVVKTPKLYLSESAQTYIAIESDNTLRICSGGFQYYFKSDGIYKVDRKITN